MDQDFKRYERDYLRRRVKDETPARTHADALARQHLKLLDTIKETESKSDLDIWDYVVLEMIKREDPRIPHMVGTLRSAEAFLKLFCHGLIAKREQSMTFDERERQQAFLDSSMNVQYQNRRNKLMTRDVKERINLISEITDLGTDDVCVLTDSGLTALTEKRIEVAKMHEEMKQSFDASKETFYKNLDSMYLPVMPMMFVMGFDTGAMAGVAGVDAHHDFGEPGFEGFGELAIGF